MSREGNLVKNTVVLAVGTFFPKLASFISLPILTAYLTHEEYGTYDLIVVLVSLFLPIVTLQIQTAAFRFLIENRQDEKEIKSIITNIYSFIIPISVLALTILFLLLHSYPIKIRICICIYYLFDMIVNATRQIVRGLSRNIEYSISAGISSFGQILFIIIAVYFMRWGLFGCILALCVSDGLSIIFLFGKLRLYRYIDFRCVSKTKLKSLLAYSWPMIPNTLSMWIMLMSDRLVVTVFMGIAANAVYSVANKLPSIMSLAQTSIVQAWQENASLAVDDDDVGSYYTSMFQCIFDFMSGVLAVLIAASPILFRLLIRGDYEEAYTQLPILFLGMLFFSLGSFVGGIYVAFFKTKSIGITTIVAAACNLLIDVSLIRWLGLYAASGSTLISYFILCIYRMKDVKKFVDIEYDIRHMVIVVGIIVAECILFSFRNLWFDIINVVIGITLFFVLNKKPFFQIVKKLKTKFAR